MLRVTPALLSQSSGGESRAIHGFAQWLSTFVSSGRGDLTQALQHLRGHAQERGYGETKFTIIRSLEQVREHQPERLREVWASWSELLRELAYQLPKAQRVSELAQISSGRLQLDISIPLTELVPNFDAKVMNEALRQLGLTRDSNPAPAPGPTAVMDAAPQVAKAAPKRTWGPLSETQWGAFVGRIISHAATEDDATALDSLVAAGHTNASLQAFLYRSPVVHEMEQGARWVQRLAAALELGEKLSRGEPLDDTSAAALQRIAQVPAGPTEDLTPPRSLMEGDLEGLVYRWLKLHAPATATAVRQHHPHFVCKEQFHALDELLATMAKERGKFLADYNVLAVMHMTGGAPAALQLLSEHLGLAPQDYLGVSVNYSGSVIAIDRLRADGYATENPEENKDGLGMLKDALGRPRPGTYDQHKIQQLMGPLERMLQKHEANGKPIMVIDDGGFVTRALADDRFDGKRHLFKVVEWTMNGVREYEQLPAHKKDFRFVPGATTAIKTEVEPPFIISAQQKAILPLIEQMTGGLRRKRVAVVGAGNIGRAMAEELLKRGAVVTVMDRDHSKLPRHPKRHLRATTDLREAVEHQDLVFLATGRGAAPSEVRRWMSPNTKIVSLSSADRDVRTPGRNTHHRFGQTVHEVSLRIGHGAQSSTPSSQPVRLFDQHLRAKLKRSGISVATETRAVEIVSAGYPINFLRRLRSLPPSHEVVPYMSTALALARAAASDAPGRADVEPGEDQRAIQIYAKHHPQELAMARGHQSGWP